ncbi:MAG: hypothetical protein HGA54_00710 [Actinobacteria bacterium]|nr:hypothetical protein [Actinomycetota bacterium]
MKKEIIVFGVSAALTLAMAPAALAVGAETDVNLHINDAQIDVTVPTDITFNVGAAGAFTCPSASSYTITNNSIFPVYVSQIDVNMEPDFTLVSQLGFATSANNDVMWSKLQPDTGTTLDLVNYLTPTQPTAGDWDMAATGDLSSGNIVQMTTSGAIKNITKDLSLSTQAMTVLFTVAGGSAS